MTADPNSHQPSTLTDIPETASNNAPAISPILAKSQVEPHLATMPRSILLTKNSPHPSLSLMIAIAIGLMFVGLGINNFWLGLSGAIVALLVSVRVIWPAWKQLLEEMLPAKERSLLVAILGIMIAIAGLLQFLGVYQRLGTWGSKIPWEAAGTLAEWFGALGQIFIAVIAVYVAWRQYVISRDLTIQQNALTFQQNILTQQQTIDTYFQGISDLVLDEEGLLEDWPQERLLAEGRTAAILSSVDASGKSKILRFLSSSKLLTPLMRDSRLGRAIFDGTGGYAEDRLNGVRVIDLGVMLAKADLSGTDLRRTDLSDANLVAANLSGSDLVKANLSRTILYNAQLVSADLKAARLFYGSIATATPRSHSDVPNYKTGVYTGVVIENADLSNVEGLSEEQRQYCCAWGGEKTRATIPGGCDDIPNQLDR